MPQPSDHDAAPAVPPFRQSLLECEDLYRSCAEDYAREHPDLIRDAPDSFVERMLELHRGLVLKVFVEMVQANPHVSAAELELGHEVIAHAWGRNLSDEQVKETLIHYSETTHLRWDSLLRPFERFSTFRQRSGELQALVERIARQVASANGRVSEASQRQVRWICSQMRSILERVPLAGSPPAEPAGARAPARAQAKARPGDFEMTAQSAARAARAARFQERATGEQLAEVLEELDGLIGLDSIKQDVRELANFLKIQAERAKYDLPQTPVSLHAVFSGNPGTGKTTIARFYGRLLGAMGLLSGGHLVETDRSGLVAEYAGQTAPKTNQRIDEALDGVLFIDEAYSLVAEGGDDPYGAEALQALLKRMEDDRDRLVVILAGYPRPLTQLLRTNPGLSSRFGRTFAFPDYTLTELGRIFEAICHRDHYQLPGRTRAKLLLGFRHLLAHKDEHFGNGRLVRNIFERSVRRLANRLASVTPLTRALLTTLQPEDIVLEDVPESAWAELDSPSLEFRLTCPHCQTTSKLPAQHLGRKVQCRRCQHEFTAAWGEPVADG